MRLRCLEIENFALIRRASMTFADGLTVCSGETGSGKTMLLEALGFVLGARASADVVSAGAARARATLRIEADEAMRQAFAREGFAAEPDEDVLFAREMSAAGKSSARVNGCPATTAQLRAAGARVVDIVGQHDQQRLLSRKHQLAVLDRFAGEDVLRTRARLAGLHARVEELRASLDGAQEDAARARAEHELAQRALRELDDAALRVDEERELRERRDYLANAERIASALAFAREALTGGDAAVVEGLGAAAGAIGAAVRFSDALRALHERIVALQSDANEAAAAVSRELDEAERDPRELEAIGARLDLLERVKRKYGGTTESALLERARAEAVVKEFETCDERLAASAKELSACDEELAREASLLTKAREEAARSLEKSVEEELRGLAMPAARFVVALEPSERIDANGAERAEFLLSSNPGEPPRALAQAASGGELSRVLLALASASAADTEAGALIFDEIDAGIGGATANAAGARLSALASRMQVVCVTHLAQIASWADAHYVMRKRSEAGETFIELDALTDAAVVREEIARMLSGNTADAALRHAETLLEDAGRAKIVS